MTTKTNPLAKTVKVTYTSESVTTPISKLKVYGGLFGSMSEAVAVCLAGIEDTIPVGDLDSTFTLEVHLHVLDMGEETNALSNLTVVNVTHKES
ncbi:MAG: hypothetical protein LUQ37_05910 [Methanoregulaceae archaeon]|jgi:hypothetical protein|nr:hypothetical protein [Methanoregulaceae archaeon]